MTHKCFSWQEIKAELVTDAQECDTGLTIQAKAKYWSYFTPFAAIFSVIYVLHWQAISDISARRVYETHIRFISTVFTFFDLLSNWHVHDPIPETDVNRIRSLDLLYVLWRQLLWPELWLSHRLLKSPWRANISNMQLFCKTFFTF